MTTLLGGLQPSAPYVHPTAWRILPTQRRLFCQGPRRHVDFRECGVKRSWRMLHQSEIESLKQAWLCNFGSGHDEVLARGRWKTTV